MGFGGQEDLPQVMMENRRVPSPQGQAQQEQFGVHQQEGSIDEVANFLLKVKSRFPTRPAVHKGIAGFISRHGVGQWLLPAVSARLGSAVDLIEEFKDLIFRRTQRASNLPTVTLQSDTQPSFADWSSTPGPSRPFISASQVHSAQMAAGLPMSPHEEDGDPWNDKFDSDYRPGQVYAAQKTQQEDIQKLLSMPDIDIPRQQRMNTPTAMVCNLMEHQKVCLTWLVKQEQDNHKKGGLLADTMGLGKTVQALALILARPSTDRSCKTTLIVAPVALLKQWEQEIETKVKDRQKLKTLIYHGRGKKNITVDKLLSYDVVLTTYGTVSWEHQRLQKQRSKRGLVLLADKTHFHRIILDEAHNIKNRRAKSSLAVTQLNATYRLCMTGTPFMNNTAEIFSLIRFLRISPYNVWENFNLDIEKPLRGWNPDEHSDAMRKLQALFRSITLRRTKTSTLDGQPILVLPERIVEVDKAEFDEDQMEFYTALQEQQQLKLNKYLRKGTRGRNYTYILILLLRLRQACDHPHLIKDHGIPDGATLSPDEMLKLATKFDDEAIEKVNRQREFRCPVCEDVAETPMIIYRCGHHICGECFSGMMANKNLGDILGEEEEDISQCPCPHDDCDEEISPDAVLCHCYFAQVHGPGELGADVGIDITNDVRSDEEDSDADEYGNLKDFVVFDEGDEGEVDVKDDQEVKVKVKDDKEVKVNDEGNVKVKDEEVDDDSDIQEHATRRTRSAKSHAISFPNFEDEDEDEYEDEVDGGSSNGGHPIKKRNSWLPDAGQDDEGSEFCEGDEGDNDENDYLVSANEDSIDIDEIKKPKEESDDDSDTDSLPSLGDVWKKAAESKVKVEDQKDWGIYASATSGTKRKRLIKKEEEEEDEDVKPRKKAKKDTKATVKFEKSEGKTKKWKNDFVTLAALKKAASSNATLKAKYLARLRKDYVSSAKIDKTMAILQDIQQNKPQEKTLVFSLWTSFLDLVEIPIHDAGFKYTRYDGSLTPSQRDASVKDFMNKPDVKIMLVSLTAGNAGLNLTAASQVIITEPFWNPFVEDQAVDRAHRIGQKRQVTVHRILVAGTVEDRILALQEKKRRLVNEALSEEGAQGVGRLSIHELKGLFGLG